MNPLILIPARMQATRLPGKPLADIGGIPMIVHVWRRAVESGVGRVAVATDDGTIAAAITAAGGQAVMTRTDHPSGSDRIFEAVTVLDPDGAHDVVVNLQGDLPTLDPALVKAAAALLADPVVDIATLAAIITAEHERTDPNVVKVVGTPVGSIGSDGRPVMGASTRLRALYFTRATAPHGPGPLYHHIGIYGYRRAALTRFVGLPPSPLEMREKLEQLRALEAGLRIDVAVVATVPLGVDTPADLDRARAMLAS
ncbi:MAG: 3-deoxy-manno-octulosonate cytidylyltransferase [Hyphomicrobium aestuarii]|nr:3-deoxy-manno-octulosonate cytidylyltransferase [Hyphomicrobium aestuarii]